MENKNWYSIVENCSGEFQKTDFDDFITLIVKIFYRKLMKQSVAPDNITDILDEYKGGTAELDLLKKGLDCILDGFVSVYIRTLMDFEILKLISGEPKLSDEMIMKLLIARESIIALQQDEFYVIESFGARLCSKYSEIFTKELWSKVDTTSNIKDAVTYSWKGYEK